MRLLEAEARGLSAVPGPLPRRLEAAAAGGIDERGDDAWPEVWRRLMTAAA